VVVTHDAQLASWADRVVRIRDGRIIDQAAAAPDPGSLLGRTGDCPHPHARGTGNGGVPARRAVFRWGWRLFRREWRQQLLLPGLLTLAVAATIWGAGVVTNVQLRYPSYATFGTAAALAAAPRPEPGSRRPHRRW
jgi:hypothetical protein